MFLFSIRKWIFKRTEKHISKKRGDIEGLGISGWNKVKFELYEVLMAEFKLKEKTEITTRLLTLKSHHFMIVLVIV